MKWSLILLVLLSSCLAPAKHKNKAQIIEGFAGAVATKYPSFAHITVSELLKLDESDYLLVDIRTPREIAVSMIPKAISLKEFQQRKLPLPKKVILYATIGERSSKLAKKWQEKIPQIANLKGGVLAWAQSGKTFVNNAVPTKRVHVKNEAWNFLSEDYEGVFDE